MSSLAKNSIPSSYGIILLAAGASSRLGKPKQLLTYNNKTLLQHSLQIAIATEIEPIVTVLGANSGLLRESLENQKGLTIINEGCGEGMASSIRCGMEALLKTAPALDGIIIMVCDQPFVTSKLLTDLVKKHQLTRKPIIASSYNSNLGTPALFDTTIFAHLRSLKGDSGAKKMMQANPDWVASVDFPFGEFDIDTNADYDLLMKESQL